jgi:hypothetical protein
MATINISQIYSIGSGLLSDSDSHLDQLLDNDLISIAIGVLFIASMAFGYKVGRNYKR